MHVSSTLLLNSLIRLNFTLFMPKFLVTKCAYDIIKQIGWVLFDSKKIRQSGNNRRDLEEEVLLDYLLDRGQLLGEPSLYTNHELNIANFVSIFDTTK